MESKKKKKMRKPLCLSNTTVIIPSIIKIKEGVKYRRVYSTEGIVKVRPRLNKVKFDLTYKKEDDLHFVNDSIADAVAIYGQQYLENYGKDG